MRDEQPPTGLARRRRRLSDEETAQRMLRTALAMVNETGLTVSLEHIGFEDVIREAGVSRSAVYRRWPYKDLFFSDLLKELAGATGPAALAEARSSALVRRVVLERLDWLATPAQRHDLCVELLRQGALGDFETIHGSTEWRTFIALHATFLSLADGELREEVRSALARTERGFVERISGTYARLAGLLGYRLRPGFDATFDTLATLVGATMRGLVITALTSPGMADRRVRANPFGAAGTAEWSEPALAVAGVALSFLEPDPTVVWDEARIADVRGALEADERAGRRESTEEARAAGGPSDG
ncbi:TetR/AcrR family transcriptional regulator [Streptomyces sp. I05A-00742]|uniref:TetR/AcrR family transcriptional regulator n=1 Tax=Streptomyces sp. I05A-00742 TaxID=2732853 RepID=UPI001BB201C6|nr:hypothetical protein [Streptomyces sp. I05A-00742]